MRWNNAPLVGLAALGAIAAVTPAAARARTESVVIDTHAGPRAFHLEVASDNAARARGLMHRTRLARDGGMLFDFQRPMMAAFWMKDTPLPLDILFVRADGTISMIAADAVPNSTAEIVSPEPVRFVIEINGGEANALGINSGDRVHARAFGDEKR